MNGTIPIPATSYAEDGKAASGARPNHAADCQNDRLGRATQQFASARANQSRNKAWRTALGALTIPKGDPTGECRIKQPLLPTKISELVAFLASGRSRYLTGQNMRTDGGLTASV